MLDFDGVSFVTSLIAFLFAPSSCFFGCSSSMVIKLPTSHVFFRPSSLMLSKWQIIDDNMEPIFYTIKILWKTSGNFLNL